ncbi:IS3 family transposase [Acinetobacter baumannii]|nr:IS3 family transposase [Acinetobacter baumannii]ELT0786430.1 IS3 family transposase [Acinetobacter baumannii]
MGQCSDGKYFHTLKKAHNIHDSNFANRRETHTALFEYIEVYYNRMRRHCANGWFSPIAYEQKYFGAEGSAVRNSV